MSSSRPKSAEVRNGVPGTRSLRVFSQSFFSFFCRLFFLPFFSVTHLLPSLFLFFPIFFPSFSFILPSLFLFPSVIALPFYSLLGQFQEYKILEPSLFDPALASYRPVLFGHMSLYSLSLLLFHRTERRNQTTGQSTPQEVEPRHCRSP